MLAKFKSKSTFVLIIYLLFTNLSFSDEDVLVIEIDNPKFSEKGLDDKTYEIKAKKGLRYDETLELFTVEGKFKSNSDGIWIFLSADQGNYKQSSNLIELKKNVNFYTDDGETLKSNFANFDMTNDVIDLKDKVVHINSDGKIVADNSTISENFNYITYNGNVSATFKIRN